MFGLIAAVIGTTAIELFSAGAVTGATAVAIYTGVSK